MRIIGLAGWSGAGKTTLIVKLIPLLQARGYSVSTLKHGHHNFDVDQPGKDSYRHREAGAHEVMIASANRFALMHELRGAPEPSLASLIGRLEPVDFLIVEGFKQDPYPKLEVHRAANAKPLLFPEDPNIRALATDAADAAIVVAGRRPYAHLDDVAHAADFVTQFAMPLDAVLQGLSAGLSEPRQRD